MAAGEMVCPAVVCPAIACSVIVCLAIVCPARMSGRSMSDHSMSGHSMSGHSMSGATKGVGPRPRPSPKARTRGPLIRRRSGRQGRRRLGLATRSGDSDGRLGRATRTGRRSAARGTKKSFLEVFFKKTAKFSFQLRLVSASAHGPGRRSAARSDGRLGRVTRTGDSDGAAIRTPAGSKRPRAVRRRGGGPPNRDRASWWGATRNCGPAPRGVRPAQGPEGTPGARKTDRPRHPRRRVTSWGEGS